MPIINGRRVNKEFMTGEDIINVAGPEAGRRVVLRRGFNAHTVEKDRQYGPNDLRDKKGNPVRVDTIPDRTKG